MRKTAIFLSALVVISAAVYLFAIDKSAAVSAEPEAEAEETVKALYQDKELPEGTVIDKIEILKADRKLNIYEKDVLLKTYKIALGFEPVGHKEFQGDGKTPEGKYKVDGKNPGSAYHKNLGVSYPNDKDRAHAKKNGKSPGGDIKIHGIGKTYGYLGKLHALHDWTLGCIAVTNEEIDEIYKHTPVGTKIEIKP
ncbi:murein L [Elusimicrobium posterum]|uniref:L,D-transpeptidase family protein n=1 Tax=Elusimicrobium posterum TaxID=3116653 RepID=UPI003C751F95